MTREKGKVGPSTEEKQGKGKGGQRGKREGGANNERETRERKGGQKGKAREDKGRRIKRNIR